MNQFVPNWNEKTDPRQLVVWTKTVPSKICRTFHSTLPPSIQALMKSVVYHQIKTPLSILLFHDIRTWPWNMNIVWEKRGWANGEGFGISSSWTCEVIVLTWGPEEGRALKSGSSYDFSIATGMDVMSGILVITVGWGGGCLIISALHSGATTCRSCLCQSRPSLTLPLNTYLSCFNIHYRI